MNPLGNAQLDGRVERLCIQLHGLAPHRRKEPEVDVTALLRAPLLYQRLELVAVGTTVGEHLHHLDPAAVARGDRLVQHDVVLARHKGDLLLLRRSGLLCADCRFIP